MKKTNPFSVAIVCKIANVAKLICLCSLVVIIKRARQMIKVGRIFC